MGRPRRQKQEPLTTDNFTTPATLETTPTIPTVPRKQSISIQRTTRARRRLSLDSIRPPTGSVVIGNAIQPSKEELRNAFAHLQLIRRLVTDSGSVTMGDFVHLNGVEHLLLRIYSGME